MYGSSLKTSRAAPATFPERSAASSASSSSSGPRAALTTRTPGRIASNAAAPTEPRVSAVSGRCRVRKSAAAYTSSGDSTHSAPSSRKRSAVTYGS